MLRIIECGSIEYQGLQSTGMLFGAHEYIKDAEYMCGAMFGSELNNAYGYWSYDGGQYIFENKLFGVEPRKTTTKWGTNDIIEMTLDLTKDKGILYFKVNNEFQGILSDQLDVNKNWEMFISIAKEGAVQYIEP